MWWFFVDKLCKEYNLRYSLAGGTLIGAIRHKGFIPWDDDIDIFMPRPDFDKFIDVFNEINSSIYIISSPYDKNNFLAGNFLQIYNKNTFLKLISDKYDIKLGAYIDIFPIDGLPNNLDHAKKHYSKYKLYRKILHVISEYRYRKDSAFKNLLSKVFNPLGNSALESLVRYYYKYDFNSSKYCALLEPGNRLESNLLETDFFNNLIEVPFEDKKFLAFADYDVYLKRYYGDYMKFPPVEERQRPHNFELYV